MHSQAPPYLSELLKPYKPVRDLIRPSAAQSSPSIPVRATKPYKPVRDLRSSAANRLEVPQANTATMEIEVFLSRLTQKYETHSQPTPACSRHTFSNKHIKHMYKVIA